MTTHLSYFLSLSDPEALKFISTCGGRGDTSVLQGSTSEQQRNFSQGAQNLLLESALAENWAAFDRVVDYAVTQQPSNETLFCETLFNLVERNYILAIDRLTTRFQRNPHPGDNINLYSATSLSWSKAFDCLLRPPPFVNFSQITELMTPTVSTVHLVDLLIRGVVSVARHSTFFQPEVLSCVLDELFSRDDLKPGHIPFALFRYADVWRHPLLRPTVETICAKISFEEVIQWGAVAHYNDSHDAKIWQKFLDNPEKGALGGDCMSNPYLEANHVLAVGRTIQVAMLYEMSAQPYDLKSLAGVVFLREHIRNSSHDLPEDLNAWWTAHMIKTSLPHSATPSPVRKI